MEMETTERSVKRWVFLTEGSISALAGITPLSGWGYRWIGWEADFA
jgi:hypothetical protein